MSEKDYTSMLESGCILYFKDGIIRSVRVPDYGEVTLYSHNGKINYVKRTETTK